MRFMGGDLDDDCTSDRYQLQTLLFLLGSPVGDPKWELSHTTEDGTAFYREHGKGPTLSEHIITAMNIRRLIQERNK